MVEKTPIHWLADWRSEKIHDDLTKPAVNLGHKVDSLGAL